jgi:hypothetical protein
MFSTTKLNTGRVILSIIAVGTVVSPFLADWNATHIYNPLWTPHAKFHNAQTMAMAVLLGLAALFYTWRKSDNLRASLLPAWLFAGFYWISQTLAFVFPGVAWTDPDLLPPGHSLTEFPLQLKGDVVLFALLALAGWLLVSATRNRSSN